MASDRTDRPFLVFGAPDLREPEMEEVAACLRDGWIGSGPRVARFETAFAAYQGAGHPIAVSSCTAALHLSMLVAGIGPGDEVITSALTFASTVNAILHAGATPVLADVDPATMNIDPAAVEASVSPATRALLPVHFAGRACDMEALGGLVARRGLRMIEDCAHAIETRHGGRAAGTLGDFGCFSFYVTKNVTTGEGGLVLAREAADAARLKRLALHGLSADAWKRFGDEGYRHYDVVECGFKYNMMDLSAAIGIHQLARVEEGWRRRDAIWARYDAELEGLPLQRPAHPAPDTRHARHLYTVLLRDDAPVSRDAFLDAMTEAGVGTGVHYRAIPEHPYYRERFGWRPEDVPHATDIGRRTVSLPLSAALTDADVSRVIAAVRRILA